MRQSSGDKRLKLRIYRRCSKAPRSLSAYSRDTRSFINHRGVGSIYGDQLRENLGLRSVNTKPRSRRGKRNRKMTRATGKEESKLKRVVTPS